MSNDMNFIIAPLLRRGAENAITTKELRAMTGIRSDRQIRSVVKAEREQGALILADTKHGYYLPKNREECEHFVKTMRSRGISTIANIKSTAAALKRSEYGADLYHQIDLAEMMREADWA